MSGWPSATARPHQAGQIDLWNGAGSGSAVTTRFAETQPLPTYLFSFVVGDFTVETAERNGRTFHMYHRETDAAKVARNKDAIFDLHARAIAFMEEYTGIPYAFGKFDFVAIPAFQFGGMEHAGKILYNATGLLLDESATQNQYLGRASVISHETAHMWFGDLVTMRWFNDVWMKEVFANFMAAKIVNPSFPEVNHDLRFLYAHYPAAYDVDRTAGTNAIRQPLDNLNEAGSLYGAIIYQKAPIVMRHLEQVLGETSFRDGLRDYLKAHAFGNATWSDLIAVLDARTPVDLVEWSRIWVESPGRPMIATELEIHAGRITRLAFRQADGRGRGLVWPQQLRVVIDQPDGPRTIAVDFSGPRATVAEVIGWPAPRYVLPTGGGWAYGGFVLDPMSRGYLSRAIGGIADPLTRGAAWVTLWETMLDGDLAGSTFVDSAMAAVSAEPDEQTRARLLGYVAGAWWRHLSDTERAERAAGAEKTLRAGLDAAATASQKAAWFGALRRMATTPATLTWLGAVWAKTETVAGLPLAETDYSGAGARSRGARGDRLAEDPRRPAGAHRQSRSPRPLPVHHAGAVRRRRGAREVVRGAEGRGQPAARAVGARRARVPAPSAARRGVGEIRAAEPRPALGDPEDRRHLLPEALGGRDAGRLPRAVRGDDGARLPGRGTAVLSRPADQHRPAVGRRAVPHRRPPVGVWLIVPSAQPLCSCIAASDAVARDLLPCQIGPWHRPRCKHQGLLLAGCACPWPRASGRAS